jgi:cytochrome b561
LSIFGDLRQIVRNPLPPVYHGTVARFFHWLAVASVAAAFLTAYLDRVLPNDREAMIGAHRQIGVAILALTVLRFAWRAQYRAPPMVRPLPRLMHGVSSAVQSLLYLSLVTQPMLGWLYTSARGRDVILLGVVKLPRLMPNDRIFADTVQGWHDNFGLIFAVLIGLHIAGAFYHHFIRRDGLLLTMLPARRFPRFEFQGTCLAAAEGGAMGMECRMADISVGGAKLLDAAGWVAGQSGTLHVDGLKYSPRFLVIATHDGQVHLGFTLDCDDQPDFETALADFVATDPRVRRMVPVQAVKMPRAPTWPGSRLAR